MLPEKLSLEIVTPDKLVLTEGVDEVVMPSTEGYLGVRPGHCPLLCSLDAGEIAYTVGSQEKYLAVSGGFAEVLPDRVSILAETCEPGEEIDVERARRAQERAEAAMRAQASEIEFRHAEIDLKKALSRLRVHERSRG
jgi:F-type H+-transporting ATPase subunit epsilon